MKNFKPNNNSNKRLNTSEEINFFDRLIGQKKDEQGHEVMRNWTPPQNPFVVQLKTIVMVFWEKEKVTNTFIYKGTRLFIRAVY